MSIHLVLLTMSFCSLAAAVAGGPLTGRSTDSRRARQMAILVSTALVIGNAACLLPETPAWYSVMLIAFTCGGLVWMTISLLVSQRAGARTAQRATRLAPAAGDRRLAVVSTTSSARVAARPELPRPQLAVLPGGLRTSGPSVVEATLYDPADEWDSDVDWNAEAPAEALAARSVVTRRDLDAVGPFGTHAQSVGVARSIRTLAPESGRRRANGSAFAARVHAPTGEVLRAQVRSAYENRPEPATRLGSTRA